MVEEMNEIIMICILAEQPDQKALPLVFKG